jgi:ABC-type transporter Mla subunit MlaD
VADAQGRLFRDLDATFAALRSAAPELQDAITAARPALDAAIRELPAQRPFLRNVEGLARELRPGAAALRDAAPDLAGALTAGTPTLRAAPPFNRRLASLLDELRAFANDPRAPLGLDRLADVLEALDPTVRALAPAQVTCNYLTLFFRNLSSHLSEGDETGTWQRFIIIATPTGPNNEGGPSTAPAAGPGRDNHLHTNPYPVASRSECEAGNEPYLAGRTVIGTVPGIQRAGTEP